MAVYNASMFLDQRRKRLDEVVMREFASSKSYYDKIANVKSFKRSELRKAEFAVGGSFEKITEGKPIPLGTYVNARDKAIYPETFGLGLSFTEEGLEDIRDDLGLDVVMRATQSLGKAAAVTRELIFWDILNSGFTSVRAGIDGKPLFATDHPLLAGGSGETVANMPATGSALSYTSLMAAITELKRMKNESGNPDPFEPKLLVVPPELEPVASRLVNSKFVPTEGLAAEEGGGATISAYSPNLLNYTGLKYWVCPYLTSPTAWFLIGTKSEHDLTMFFRRPLKTEMIKDPQTRTVAYFASFRATADFVFWRGTYGNPGA